MILCDVGIVLYTAWSNLLDKRRPKAQKDEIKRAKQEYINHRRKCKSCPEWIEVKDGNAI